MKTTTALIATLLALAPIGAACAQSAAPAEALEYGVKSERTMRPGTPPVRYLAALTNDIVEVELKTVGPAALAAYNAAGLRVQSINRSDTPSLRFRVVADGLYYVVPTVKPGTRYSLLARVKSGDAYGQAQASTPAQQARVNHAYFDRMIAGPTGEPGVWVADQRATSIYTRTSDGVRADYRFVLKDGTVRETTATYVFDDDAGTIIHKSSYGDSAFRYRQTGPGLFEVEPISLVGVPPELVSAQVDNSRFEGSTIRRELNFETSTSRWMSQSGADAVLAKTQAARAKAAR